MTAAGSGRRRLGRGLEALLGPSTVADARQQGALTHVPLSEIRPNPYQPRHAFDEAALEELAQSLSASGLLQPIVVRSVDGGYELIAGERRWRAAQRLGWEDIGAVVREVDDRTLLTLALVENLQRDALSPIDEARGYRQLIDDFGASQSDVAEMVGRDRSTVANALRLLKLPDAVQQLVHQGALSTGHARALLGLGDESRILRASELVVTEGLSVREAEQLARDGAPAKPRKASRRPSAPPADVRRVEEALRRRLQTDVKVTRRGKGGRVSFRFYSSDDLARMLEIVLGEPFNG